MIGYSKIIGINVFLEGESTYTFVGTLEKKEGNFCFTYDNHYLNNKIAIPLGPDLPLIQQTIEAKNIFPSFEDRIPSRCNPAYPDYCKQFGIDPDEKDTFILLVTIGRRGSSSFIFEPIVTIGRRGPSSFIFEPNEAFKTCFEVIEMPGKISLD